MLSLEIMRQRLEISMHHLDEEEKEIIKKFLDVKGYDPNAF